MFQFESKNSELFQNNLFGNSDFVDYQWLEESSRINWDDFINPNWFPPSITQFLRALKMNLIIRKNT